MLKIKDNIDLKKLEKFGFKYKSKQDNTREHYSLTKVVSRITTYLYVWVDCEDRTIHKGTWTDDSIYADVLFDLIQAGLVEKAEYDKMKQGAKDIVKDLKQKLAEKDVDLSLARNEIDTLKHNLKVAQEHDNVMCEQYFEKCKKTNQDKISFTIEQLEKVKEHFINIKTPTLGVIRRAEMVMYIDNQIKQLKEGN